MNQMALFQNESPTSWSVTELTRYLRDLIESDYNLQDVWVSGEISNISVPSSGHLYFTLKDSTASLRCVMWRNSVSRLRFLPKGGDAVEVHGKISVYEASGQYQLYADILRSIGEGTLYQEFLRLKSKLESEGLFDQDRKRAIPSWPKKIGIVTSPTGAALQDILDTIRRRYPLVEVVLAPTSVQGIEAPPGIIQGLEELNQTIKPDVIIVARGGGSMEDLWAFNDENVARTIARSEAPVITGVGHETDFTIADFTADLRAPTPTAAAELATPDQTEIRQSLVELTKQLDQALNAIVTSHRWSLSTLEGYLQGRSPKTRILGDRQRIDEITHRAEVALKHQIQLEHTNLKALSQQLVSLNPSSILGRGFAVVTQLDGKIVRQVDQVSVGEALNVQVSDGKFGVEVTDNL